MCHIHKILPPCINCFNYIKILWTKHSSIIMSYYLNKSPSHYFFSFFDCCLCNVCFSFLTYIKICAPNLDSRILPQIDFLYCTAYWKQMPPAFTTSQSSWMVKPLVVFPRFRSHSYTNISWRKKFVALLIMPL